MLEILNPRETHHEQTHGGFWHELDSHDGISCRAVLEWSFVHSGCKLTCADVLWLTPRLRPSPPVSISAADSLWSLIVMSQSLEGCDSPVSLRFFRLSKRKPSFFQFFELSAESTLLLLFSLLKHSRQTPHPPPSITLWLGCLLLNAPLPRLLPSASVF